MAMQQLRFQLKLHSLTFSSQVSVSFLGSANDDTASQITRKITTGHFFLAPKQLGSAV